MRFRRHVENLIANLRGLPEDTSPPQYKHATGLDSLISVLEEKHAIHRETPERIIMRHWRAIVAEDADRCCPEKLDPAGRLVIRVANPVVRRELAFREREIVDRIRALDGCQGVRALVFLAG